MNTAQLLRQFGKTHNVPMQTPPIHITRKQGGILTLRYILDNMGFESHEDMLKIQEFLRDLEMEK